MRVNNSLMKQPGWRWKWAGRASLEDRPSLLVTGGCWLMRRKVIGRIPSCWQCACRGRIGRLPRPWGTCPRLGHRALAPERIRRLYRPPPVSIYAALTGRTPSRYGRAHQAHSRYLCKLRDWVHSHSYAAVFQLYAISGRAHFRHWPMQLRAFHWGWAHSQSFGGNANAFNANATSQASTRFAQLVWPHGYCWYPPKIRKNICHGLPPALKYVSLLCYFRCSRGC